MPYSITGNECKTYINSCLHLQEFVTYLERSHYLLVVGCTIKYQHPCKQPPGEISGTPRCPRRVVYKGVSI